jgi:hypothetical protein
MQKFKDLFEKNPIIIVVGVIVFIISSITTIINGGTDLMYKANSTIGWRGFEEKTINSLNASIRIEKFTETLGMPTFYREGKNGYSEHVFQRREGRYWIQAITDEDGTVVIYSVTSCDSSFKPQIHYGLLNKSIRLGESTFKEVEGDYGAPFHFFFSGTTGNSYLYQIGDMGNPGNYQTEYWGIIDACDPVGFYEYIGENLPTGLIMQDDRVDRDNPAIDKFLEKSHINTYAISSPNAQIDKILEEFQIGIDRIQIRVVYPK